MTMKQLFENKKLMIGLGLGLVCLIGLVLYFLFKSGRATSNNLVSIKDDTNANVATKQVADTSGGTISANSAASKGTLFV